MYGAGEKLQRSAAGAPVTEALVFPVSRLSTGREGVRASAVTETVNSRVLSSVEIYELLVEPTARRPLCVRHTSCGA